MVFVKHCLHHPFHLLNDLPLSFMISTDHVKQMPTAMANCNVSMANVTAKLLKFTLDLEFALYPLLQLHKEA